MKHGPSARRFSYRERMKSTYEQRKKRAVALWNSGKTLAQIADDVGVTDRTAFRYVNDYLAAMGAWHIDPRSRRAPVRASRVGELRLVHPPADDDLDGGAA